MTERLVSYVEPRLHRRVVWGWIAVAIGACLSVRLLVGYEPDLIIATLLVSLLGLFLLLHFLTQDERVSVLERMRLYQAVFPHWERVLARALIFGVPFGLMRADRVETLGDLVFAVLFFTVGGLVFGLTQEWISQWAQRRAVRYAHRHWLLR
ncbi:MAG: hypothetical protein SGI91_02010 [Alphaproteobacteria bacterium]|nr:hypothetical protein [Alphaproteobacteria bacterium]